MELKLVAVSKPEEVNLILGQSHFIKTVEDLYEALVQAVPGIRFGLAFCESSGPCLIRVEGTDPEMKELAVRNAQAIGAGHSVVVAEADGGRGVLGVIDGGAPRGVEDQAAVEARRALLRQIGYKR